MFEHLLIFPSAYLFTGLFGSILMAYVLFYMLTVRPKSTAHWNLIGFYGGLLLFYLCMFVVNSNPTDFGVLAPFEDACVLLGAVGLIRFAYRFPRDDQPHEARWVAWVFAAPALWAFGYSVRYAYHWFTQPPPPVVAPYFWLLAPGLTLLALLVFWRRTLYYAQPAQSGPFWRNAWIALRVRPTNQAARAHRHLTFAMFIALGSALFAVFAAFPQVFRIDWLYLDYGFSVTMLLSMAAIAFVYFNHAPHPLTFLVKLVGVTLVMLFVISGVFVIELTAIMSAEHAAELNLFKQITQQTAIYRDFTTLPPDVLYVISRDAAAPPDDPGYRVEFGDPAQIPGWLAPRSQHEMPLERSITFPLHGRQYQAGINSRPFNQLARQKMIRLLLLSIGSSFLMILGFSVFFRMLLVTPLKNLLMGVEHLKHGDFQTDLPIQYEDELGALTAAFNHMTRALRQAEQKQAQAVMQESEHRYRNIIENIPVGMFQSTPEGKFIYVNPAMAEMFGYASQEEMLQTVNRTSIAAVIYENPAQRAMFVQEVAQAAGHWKMFENRYRRKDGQIIDAILSFCEQRDSLTGQVFLYGFIDDITARKQAQAALQESEALLNAVGEIARIGGWELDAETLTVRWTRETYHIHEIPEAGCVPVAGALSFYHPEDRPPLERALQRALAQGEAFDLELRFITARGKHLWVRAIGRPVTVDDRIKRLIGVFQDITDRKRVEDALRASEHQLRLIVEASPLPLLLGRLTGEILMVNQAFCALFGYTRDEILSAKAAGDFYANPERDRTRVRAALKESGRISQWELPARKADGTIFDVLLSYETTTYNGQPAALAVLYDLTERKQMEAELVAAKERAETAERLKSTFLANVSHHLRTPLNVMLGFAELMAADAALPPTYQEYLTLIRQNGKDLLYLINQMLRVSKLNPQELDADEPSRQLFDLLESHAPQAMLTPQPDTSKVESDVAALRARMQSLPEDVRRRFAEATRQLDLMLMLHLIEQIRATQPALADVLTALTRNFEYEIILRIIDSA